MINIFALSGILISITSGLMAVLMFVVGNVKLHYLWGAFCVSVFIWGLGAYFIGTTNNAVVADTWWRITHIGIIFIPILFLHFVYEFLGLSKRKNIIIVYLIGLFFLITDVVGNLFIANMRWVFNQFYYDSPPGVLYPFFIIFFFGLIIYSHYILWQAHKKTNDILKKIRIKYFFIGMIISFMGGSLSFLPVFGIDFYPFLNLAVFIYPVIISYAILKHQLFNIKVIVTEVIVFLLGSILVIDLFLANSLYILLFKGLVLFLMIIFGALLIKSVSGEVKRREETEKLVNELKKANEKLKQVDEQKSEFISIASHQLRTPLTAIKGYTSMLIEGTYGEVSDKAKGIVSKIFQSSQRLVYIVNDMLDVSRIEEGRLKYTFEDVKINNLVKDVIGELKVNADFKKLKFNFSADSESLDVVISADYGKIRQAIINIIDNSIKYTEKGFVLVSLEISKNKNSLILNIKDSGIGMTKNQLKTIFEKFKRSKNAIKMHTEGSGLGLYVAKEMIKSNKGVIWATSDGLGKGSQFYIEFPIKKEK